MNHVDPRKAASHSPAPAPAPAPTQVGANLDVFDCGKATSSKSAFCKHWSAIQVDGISASEFIAFLQPLADLDGVSVTYGYREDATAAAPVERAEVAQEDASLSRALEVSRMSRAKALRFALSDEGRILIESHFVGLS